MQGFIVLSYPGIASDIHLMTLNTQAVQFTPQATICAITTKLIKSALST